MAKNKKDKSKSKNDVSDERKNSDLSLIANMANSTDNNISTMSRLQSDTEALTLSQKMDSMWDVLKKHIKKTPSFMELDDKEKLKYFREDLNYKELMNDHPIVTRYLVCMGQYSSKAFRRFLYKVKTTPMPPPQLRKKGEMEDMWVRRQADYVRYLWEAYQKGHFSANDAARVWQETYQKLKGEFDDFRNMHKKAEEKVKEDKINFTAQNLKEVLQRIKSGAQHLDPEEEKELISLLKQQLYKRRFITTMEELTKKTRLIEPVCESMGKGNTDPDVKNKEEDDKPKITMIETVDSEIYDQYDDKYKQPTSRDKVINEIRTIQQETIDEEDL